MLPARRLRIRFKSLPYCLASSSQLHTSTYILQKDHYTTLGINRNADAKEIKSAFYELSKKYHPDRNPNDKEQASIKFQDIVTAYEILSSADKRKAYDAQTTPPSYSGPQRHQGPPSLRRSPYRSEKVYTDLDIEYEDLLHFQQMARRRQRTTRFEYETAQDFLKKHDQYRSNLAMEREREERRLREEIEEKQRKLRFKTPTFEEMLQHEYRRKNAESRKNMRVALTIFFGTMSAFFLMFMVRP